MTCAVPGISLVQHLQSCLTQSRVCHACNPTPPAWPWAGTGDVSAAEAREFAAGALDALRRGSPRSLAVTLRHFAAVAAAVRGGAGPGSGQERTRMPSRPAVLGHDKAGLRARSVHPALFASNPVHGVCQVHRLRSRP